VQLEHATVKNGRGSAEAAERQLLRDLGTLSAQGEIGIAGLDGETHRPRIVWPTRPIDAVPARGGSGDRPRVIDSEAMFARLFHDQIADEIRASVAAEPVLIYPTLEGGWDKGIAYRHHSGGRL